MVVTPILSLPFKVKASFSFCFSSSFYLGLPNMSTITEVGQMGGRLGGEGQQGPEGEKEAASEVYLASASPLAPESPFAMAPLHLSGHSLACPKSPTQSAKPTGEGEDENAQVGEERWEQRALKLIPFDGFWACESPRDGSPTLATQGAPPNTFLRNFGDESPPPARSASSSSACERAHGGPVNMVGRGCFGECAEGAHTDMARLIEVHGEDVIR